MQTEKTKAMVEKQELSLDEMISDLNKYYAAVIIGGKLRIMEEYTDQSMKEDSIRFLSTADFITFYSNKKVMIGSGDKQSLKPIGGIWVQDKNRRTYHDIVFDPTRTANSYSYNLFKGFAVEPKQGNWSLMDNHILEVICNSEANLYKYVMQWLARIVQDPGGKRPGVSIVLRGSEGTGKGKMVDWFGKILGRHYLPMNDANALTGKFNDIMATKILCFADEALFAGDKKVEGKLKALITEPTAVFEKKGIDPVHMRNHVNIIMASNNDWVIPAGKSARRFCVLDVSDVHQQDIPYFKAIDKQMSAGGVEAMLYDLLLLEYDADFLRHAPKTSALNDQKLLSMTSVEGFWSHCLERGQIIQAYDSDGKAIEGEWEFDQDVNRTDIHDEYLAFCRKHNERFPEGYGTFFRQTYGRSGVFGGRRHELTRRESGSRYFRALSLDEMKELFREGMGITK